ncbi:MAG: hypothetical protein QM570_17235 [Planctomycetota bacterium]|nr:hypothetical protein [Planctomycetota bacterium]
MSVQAKRSVLLSIVALMGLSWTRPASGQIGPPTGSRDLVVFVAREKPDLYRLVGQEPIPYGASRFHNPKAIVADPQQGCFYVIDEPRLLTEKVKIWRIAGDGSAQVVLQADTAKSGGPFGLDVSLGLDHQGRPLVADRDSGLWRLNPNGQLQQLLQPKDKPLIRMTAATGCQQGWLVATSYLHETSQNAAGMILTHKNQGGLFQIDPKATVRLPHPARRRRHPAGRRPARPGRARQADPDRGSCRRPHRRKDRPHRQRLMGMQTREHQRPRDRGRNGLGRATSRQGRGQAAIHIRRRPVVGCRRRNARLLCQRRRSSR